MSEQVVQNTSAKDKERLTGNVNTIQLVLAVLAFSSPLTTMAGYFALTIGVVGITAPTAFVIVTAALLIFSVGFMTLAKRMPRSGAYYSYITTGLGRPLGLGSAYVAVVSYLLILIGLFCFLGIVVSGLVTRFGGPEIPWWVGSIACVVLVGVLGYFNVDVSVRVLVWVMVLEVLLVLIFDLAVLFQGGSEGIPLESFNFIAFSSGPELFVGLLFGILVFIGFEGTVLYRDEVKNPNRTIPRATYLAVLFIGLLYTFSSWMLVAAFGTGAQDAANEDMAGMFTNGASQFVGLWFSDTVNILLITAIIASLLSTHNMSSRYIYNLGNDGGLPKFMGKVHPKYRSPYQGSMISFYVCLAGVILLAAIGADPNVMYGAMAGIGLTGIIILMVLVCLSVIVWFRRNAGGQGDNAWKTLIAPIISAVFLSAVAIYSMLNYEWVVGGAPGERDWLLLLVFLPFVIGIFVAISMKSRAPEKYELIGGYDRTE